MKSAHRYALLCLVSVSFPLAVACGSTDSSGLFSQGSGGSAIGVGGSPSGAGSTSQAGQSTQSASGSTSTSGGFSAGAGAAGRASSTGGAAGAGSGASGMTSGGSATGGAANAGSANGGASSGAGGAGTGGGAGAGGANSSGAGGVSASGAGGASGGASGGTGGSGGSSGASACPDTAPQEGVVCTVATPDNCFYAGEACSCLSDGIAVDGRKWGCFGTPDKCPPQVPTDGTSCKNYGGGMCAYSAQDFCVCMPAGPGGPAADPKWACGNASPVCPLTRPDKSALCTDVKECDYVDRECFCDGAAWTCE